MSESDKPSTPPVWPQLMRLDKAATKPPPSWQEWKKRYGFWDWVLWPEWAAEWVVHWSRSWDFVKVLELAGRFTILIVAVTWFFEFDDRERARQDAIKAKHYRAWELINSARGSTGDGGRRYALQDLNDDKVSLAATPLSQAHLVEVKLPGADLSLANLSEANLRRANLSRANLVVANLSKAYLSEANLSGAYLSRADLSEASLSRADLSGASLIEANLSRADLSEANLSGAFVGRFPLERPLEWLPPGWEVFDDKGFAHLRRSGAPPAPPQ